MKRRNDYSDDVFADYCKYVCNEEPENVKNVTGYHEYDDGEIMIELNDGNKLLYNRYDKSVRMFTPKRLDISEMTQEKFLREFAYRLATKILSSGYNQDDLSNESGVSRAMISRYLNGESMPSIYNAYHLARALGCTVDELLRFPKF